MCNTTGIDFGARMLTPERIAGKDVIDVGALDVNGSLRPVVEPLGPARTRASTSRWAPASTRSSRPRG